MLWYECVTRTGVLLYVPCWDLRPPVGTMGRCAYGMGCPYLCCDVDCVVRPVQALRRDTGHDRVCSSAGYGHGRGIEFLCELP